jgi:hypothetical protein
MSDMCPPVRPKISPIGYFAMESWRMSCLTPTPALLPAQDYFARIGLLILNSGFIVAYYIPFHIADGWGILCLGELVISFLSDCGTVGVPT